jgi:aminoglycoside N3'-acetyltransferase
MQGVMMRKLSNLFYNLSKNKKDTQKIKIYKQLQALNVRPSDTVLINLNIEKFGLLESYRRSDYIKLFKEYFELGGGTFIALAFTRVKFSFTNKNLPFFNGTQSAHTGAFANAMLKDKDALRSKHPTNSVVAIGKNAKKFVDGLDEERGAYEFARRAIEMDAKVLLIGTSEYPGFVTHLVEQDLKLYQQYWNRFFLKVQLKDRVFKRLDPGGCSTTFDRLYPEYIKHEALRIGFVNQAYSLCIDAKKAYEIDYNVISKKMNLLICDNPNCSTCRIFRWKTIWRVPFFVLKKIIQKIYHYAKKCT